MTQVRLGIDAWERNRANEPAILVENLFFEQNPTNLVEKVSLLLRPALKYRTNIDDNPAGVRKMNYEEGCFLNDAFVVVGEDLYRIHKNYNLDGSPAADTVTQIPGIVQFNAPLDVPDICIRNIDPRVFIADGYTLQQTNGLAALATIVMPDDVPPVSLDSINHYVIVVQGQSQRCYWINPGEIVIDPLNFFEAERSPDWLLQVRTVGDQFWLMGRKTTEVWRHTGNVLAPFQRIEGRLFDRGIWGGTAVKIKNSVIVVGNDGHVYDVQGGPEPISNPGIAELIRDAIAAEGLE